MTNRTQPPKMQYVQKKDKNHEAIQNSRSLGAYEQSSIHLRTLQDIFATASTCTHISPEQGELHDANTWKMGHSGPPLGLINADDLVELRASQ